MIPEKLRNILERQQYRLAGSHSAVKICNWTKRSLLDNGCCYKEKFYGIKSHRCLQMTPAVAWCTNKCVYCWRAIEETLGSDLNGVKLNSPSEIIDLCIESQRELLSGFKGNEKINMLKWKEAQNPNQAAISLSGEPTLYPNISELVKEFKKRKFSTFLVTNGQNPDRLDGLENPTNLYISLDAPDKATYKKIDCPVNHDYWERFLKSLELMNSFSCTKVLRLTLSKGINMNNIQGYSKLIGMASPDFIEVKGYMFVGSSRKRMKRENMPSHEEVKDFSSQLSNDCGYKYENEHTDSRVVLLKK